VERDMGIDKEKEKLHLELQEEITKLKKRIKDLERERDILLALHRRDYD
jgi:cell division protein FtsB